MLEQIVSTLFMKTCSCVAEELSSLMSVWLPLNPKLLESKEVFLLSNK